MEPMPTSTPEHAAQPPTVRRTPILLLSLSALLLLGTGYLLFASNKTPQQPSSHDETTRPAPVVTGKTERELRAELMRINQELDQAKAEREATLKAIEQMSKALEQKLKEAQLDE